MDRDLPLIGEKVCGVHAWCCMSWGGGGSTPRPPYSNISTTKAGRGSRVRRRGSRRSGVYSLEILGGFRGSLASRVVLVGVLLVLLGALSVCYSMDTLACWFFEAFDRLVTQRDLSMSLSHQISCGFQMHIVLGSPTFVIDWPTHMQAPSASKIQKWPDMTLPDELFISPASYFPRASFMTSCAWVIHLTGGVWGLRVSLSPLLFHKRGCRIYVALRAFR